MSVFSSIARAAACTTRVSVPGTAAELQMAGGHRVSHSLEFLLNPNVVIAYLPQTTVQVLLRDLERLLSTNLAF
jgi:hypothetical protein